MLLVGASGAAAQVLEGELRVCGGRATAFILNDTGVTSRAALGCCAPVPLRPPLTALGQLECLCCGAPLGGAHRSPAPAPLRYPTVRWTPNTVASAAATGSAPLVPREAGRCGSG